MWRSILLTYPFVAVYVLIVVPVFVPVTLLTGSIEPMYWLARLGCRIALRLGGVRVRVLHKERAFEHPCCVFVPNHVSNLEPPALFMHLPRIAVVMKQSLGRIPLLGYAMRLGGFVTVDRKARDSRRDALGQALEMLRRGISMMIFPEGTRNPKGPLLPFRPGPFQIAIEAGVPVVPVTVHGAAELMPRDGASFRPGQVTIAFHEPIPTDGLAENDHLALMERSRAVMQAALDQDTPPE